MVFIHSNNFSRLAHNRFFKDLSANMGEVLGLLGDGEKLLVCFDGVLPDLVNGHVVYEVGVYDPDKSYEDTDRYYGLIVGDVLHISSLFSEIETKAVSIGEGLHLDKVGAKLDEIDNKIEDLESELRKLKREREYLKQG